MGKTKHNDAFEEESEKVPAYNPRSEELATTDSNEGKVSELKLDDVQSPSDVLSEASPDIPAVPLPGSNSYVTSAGLESTGDVKGESTVTNEVILGSAHVTSTFKIETATVVEKGVVTIVEKETTVSEGNETGAAKEMSDNLTPNGDIYSKLPSGSEDKITDKEAKPESASQELATDTAEIAETDADDEKKAPSLKDNETSSVSSTFISSYPETEEDDTKKSFFTNIKSKFKPNEKETIEEKSENAEADLAVENETQEPEHDTKKKKFFTNLKSKFKRTEKETTEEPPPIETAEDKPKAADEPPPEDLPLVAPPGEPILNEININGNEEVQTPSDVAGCLGTKCCKCCKCCASPEPPPEQIGMEEEDAACLLFCCSCFRRYNPGSRVRRQGSRMSAGKPEDKPAELQGEPDDFVDAHEEIVDHEGETVEVQRPPKNKHKAVKAPENEGEQQLQMVKLEQKDSVNVGGFWDKFNINSVMDYVSGSTPVPSSTPIEDLQADPTPIPPQTLPVKPPSDEKTITPDTDIFEGNESPSPLHSEETVALPDCNLGANPRPIQAGQEEEGMAMGSTHSGSAESLKKKNFIKRRFRKFVGFVSRVRRRSRNRSKDSAKSRSTASLKSS